MKLNNTHFIIFLIVILLFSLFFVSPTIEGFTSDFKTSFDASFNQACMANGNTQEYCSEQATIAYNQLLIDSENQTYSATQGSTTQGSTTQGSATQGSTTQGSANNSYLSDLETMGQNSMASLSSMGQGLDNDISNLFNSSNSSNANSSANTSANLNVNVNSNSLSTPIPGSNIFSSGGVTPVSSNDSATLFTSNASSSSYPQSSSTSSSPSSIIVGPGGQQILATTQNTINGIPSSQIPRGQENLYILKSEIVPPVCPACPNVIIDKSIVKKECQPCPPCARCPEPSFDCKKVPNYSLGVANTYLPRPVLNDFSQFGS